MTTPLTPMEEQVIALAGIAQAAHQVHRIATTGQSDAAAVQPLIDSLFAFDPDSTEAVYGSLAGVRPGLQVLGDVFGQQDPAVFEPVMRYMLGIIQLAGQLRHQDEMTSIIHSRLEHADRHRQHFPGQAESLAHSIAAIYQDTISTLRFRIKVSGAVNHLQDTANAELIRTLLLAGIRSAWLWQQVGGKRWHWLFLRPKLIATVTGLLRR